MPRRAALAVVLLAATLPTGAAQPQFWRIEGARDFLDGESDGLSVDSDGHVHLAPSSRVAHDPETPYVWCLARDGKGAVYAGTGNDGKIFRIEDGAAKLFYDSNELEVHALAVGHDGKLYAGTAPDGKVYAIDGSGKAEVFFDPSEKYIWALAFDAKHQLLVATGAEGKVYRVDEKGKGAAILTTSETHVTSLAVDEAGAIYAGSSPGGIIYRIDPAGKVFVVYDSPYREVKALGLGRNGALYAALVDGKDKEKEEAPRPVPVFSSQATPTAEVTVTETFSVAPTAVAAAPLPSPPATQPPARTGSTKGALLRVLPTGEIETLWSSTDDAPHALVVQADGVLVGTGNKGKLYRVRDDRTWTMLGAFPSEQLTALVAGPKAEVTMATSNPGKIYALDGSGSTKGTFTSKVKDTDTISSWGRLRWDAALPAGTEIQIQSRSGNTGTPDGTWTEWSPAYTSASGETITSERARFLQLRAILVGKPGVSPTLSSISAAFLQRNLRPQVQSITVHPAGEVFQKPISLTGEIEILGLDPADAPEPRASAAGAPRNAAASAALYGRKLYQKGIQTLSWKADDPNNDGLVYDVSYRLQNDTRFRVLRKGLTDSVLAWDTTTVPNGRYVVKVTAWDSSANPRAMTLSGEKESAPFDVDNTPPALTASLVKGAPAKIQVVVKDDTSIIRKTEYAVDGNRWQEVHPQDGINDSLEEKYEIAPELEGPGPHVVVIRAADLLGNVATTRVEVP